MVGILSLLVSAPAPPLPLVSPGPGVFYKINPASGSQILGERVTLSWSISSQAESYEYCYDIIDDNACSTWKSNGKGTSITVGDLKKGKEYFWHVRAVNSERVTYSDGGSRSYWSYITERSITLPPFFASEIYLPINLNQGSPIPPISLAGQVTYRGIPEAFTEVELVYYNGSSEYIYASTNTDQQGMYQFKNLPYLSGDQYLQVRKINPNDTSWLSSWYCTKIYATTDPNLHQCDFDMENVYLISPQHGSYVPLPQLFKWSTRVTRSDSYVFHLSDMSDGDPFNYPYFQSKPLGYSGSFYLAGTPTGFTYYRQYGWWVSVLGPNGEGASHYYYYVTFE
jgi:hypothetical protein